MLIPSPTNHWAQIPEFRLQDFVSHSSYLDMIRAPTRLSLEILRFVIAQALVGDGIRYLLNQKSESQKTSFSGRIGMRGFSVIFIQPPRIVDSNGLVHLTSLHKID